MKILSKHSIFFLLLFSLNNISNAQTDWEVINSPTNELLRNLYFVDENYGWAAGRNGVMIRTTNGGDDWTILNTGITSTIYDLFFLNKNLGWIITFPFTPPYITKILTTTNGGDTWSVQEYPDEFVFFRTVFFLDSLTGFIGGDFIARTSDGGQNWARMHVDSSIISDYPVIKFKFYDNIVGYASGGSRDQAGVMWRTSDGGFNWSAEGVSPDEVFDFHIKDSLNVIALSGDPEFIYPVVNVTTFDAGLNWLTTEIPHFTLSYAIDFRTPDEGWSASGIFFLYTSDGGENWQMLDTPDTSAVFDLQFVNDTLGFACGQDGVILRFTIPGVDSQITVTDFKLYQNFPNPFNSDTKIRYSLPNSISNEALFYSVQIKVFDVLGREVRTIVNEEQSSGFYELEFKADGMSSGVYFYTISAGNFKQTKKMMLVR